MKIDLHVHSSERSACSQATELELIRAGIAAGLDGMAFTDHDRLASGQHLEELNRTYAPFHIYTGIEVSLAEEHVVVLGIHDPDLESWAWEYEDLWRFVRRNGGFMTLAHPFRFHNHIAVDIERFPPDAIEVYSYNTAPRNEERIRTLAGRLGIGLLANSDAHRTHVLGKYYNDLNGLDSAEDQALLRRLRQNHFTPVKIA